MTVTITITDPTATEATALRAYLTALHGGTSTAPLATGDRGPELYVPNGYMDIVVAEANSPNFRSSEVKLPPDFTIISRDGEPTTAEDAGAPDFDSAGMPWDERIHASSRATVADGTWRKKRGVSDELVAAVEAELARDALTAHDESIGRYEEEGGMTDAVTVEVPDAPEPNVIEAHDLGHTPDTPPPPPAPTANPFLAVMSRIGKSKLDKAKKDELLTAAGALDEKGAPSILVLNKRPELIDGFIALLDSEGV